MYKIQPPCPHMGCGVVERHLEMVQPSKKITGVVVLVLLGRKDLINVGKTLNEYFHRISNDL